MRENYSATTCRWLVTSLQVLVNCFHCLMLTLGTQWLTTPLEISKESNDNMFQEIDLSDFVTFLPEWIMLSSLLPLSCEKYCEMHFGESCKGGILLVILMYVGSDQCYESTSASTLSTLYLDILSLSKALVTSPRPPPSAFIVWKTYTHTSVIMHAGTMLKGRNCVWEESGPHL